MASKRKHWMSMFIHCIEFIAIISIRHCFYGPAAWDMEITLFYNSLYFVFVIMKFCCIWLWTLLSVSDLESLFVRLILSLLALCYDSSLQNKLHIRIASYEAQEETFLSFLSDSAELPDFKMNVPWDILFSSILDIDGIIVFWGFHLIIIILLECKPFSR